MATRKSGSCSQCGNGHGNGNGSGGKKSKFWYWVAGIAAVWFLTQGAASNDGGHSDYKPPSQTTQKKCDPNALLQLGCTP